MTQQTIARRFRMGFVYVDAERKQTMGQKKDRDDLIESDPHGILPRHRELLASVYEERGCTGTARTIRDGTELGALQYDAQAALIALARLEKEGS